MQTLDGPMDWPTVLMVRHWSEAKQWETELSGSEITWLSLTIAHVIFIIRIPNSKFENWTKTRNLALPITLRRVLPIVVNATATMKAWVVLMWDVLRGGGGGWGRHPLVEVLTPRCLAATVRFQVWSIHNSILCCWLFTIMDRCKKWGFSKTHNQS